MKKQVASATARKDKLVASIYALATHGHMKFSECLAIAGADLVAKYETECSKLSDLQANAVASGKAWRGTFGMLVWNR